MATSISTLPASVLATAIDDQQRFKHSPFTSTDINYHVKVIGPIILIYDWLLNIDSELTHVWSRRWGVMEWMYLSSRYMPFADTTIMLLYHFFLVDPSIESCRTALATQCWMYNIGMTISQTILMIRTWALWERNKTLGLALFVEAALTSIVSLYGTGSFANSLTWGCFVLTSSKMLYINSGLLLFTETIYLVLILLKAYRMGNTIQLFIFNTY
ncbi:uncharacterized protein EDB91DRAFT_1085045 [Suillus paluster]|uniref:uncharacterized protein n=1 Tax=Suillus paluster TaxID=48578 RepID=UPI001B887341|nr:uncharacterized protein EDB91DRAFT_1085045 [Suillus paluster]KAG1731499.1 hypothetical protein EDB91DRAFT_1085045 [Suillus paluster]